MSALGTVWKGFLDGLAFKWDSIPGVPLRFFRESVPAEHEDVIYEVLIRINRRDEPSTDEIREALDLRFKERQTGVVARSTSRSIPTRSPQSAR
jgi:hypothetical protein